MSDKPKPCPFCGDTEAFPTHCDPNCCDSVRWFECKCGAMASNEVSWNTRPAEEAKDAEIARLNAEVDSLYAQLEATRIEYSRKVTRTFNEGYRRGHDDTVEGLYVDIHESDMDSYKHN